MYWIRFSTRLLIFFTRHNKPSISEKFSSLFSYCRNDITKFCVIKNQPAACHHASFAVRICCCFYISIFMHAKRFWSLRYIHLNPNTSLVSISSFLFSQQQNGSYREGFFTLFPIDSFFHFYSFLSATQSLEYKNIQWVP